MSWAVSIGRRAGDSARWPGKFISPVLDGAPSLLGPRSSLKAWEKAGDSQVAVLSVYRRRNSAVLQRLLRDCRLAGMSLYLWGLDGVAHELADETLGEGPGLRCELLNRLLCEVGESTDWIVVVDDDVELLRGWSIPAALGAMSLLGVDFAQPAHASGSIHSHTFNVRRPVIAARTVRTVEIGPLIMVRQPWISSIVPFPADGGMGYYLEWFWAELSGLGCRSAVLDCVPMRHLGSVASEYPSQSAGKRSLVDGSEFDSLDDLNRASPSYGRPIWPRWRRVRSLTSTGKAQR